MSLILSSRPWDSQPQEVVEPDYANGIAEGLSLLHVPANTPGNGLRRTVGSGGIGMLATAAASGGAALASREIGTVGTVLLVATFNGGIGAGTTEFYFDNVSGATRDILYRNGSNVYSWYIGGTQIFEGSGSPLLADFIDPVSRPLVFRWASGSQQVFRDGRLYTTASVALSTSSTRRFLLCSEVAVRFGLLNGGIQLFAYWPRRLSDAEVVEVSSNPWQLFKPRRIWVPVSAGGGSVSLTVADATHAHTVDGLALTSATALSVADATHAHAADAITLAIGSVLTVAEASHAHAADSLTLTAASALAVADATHSHAVDNITLSVAGATNLTVAEALHSHAADGLTLTAASVLAIQEALHAHAADNVTLDASGAVNLLLADGLHAHTADGVALTVAAWLTVADALHGHAADNVALTFGGVAVEPLARYTITAAPRMTTITAAARRLEIRK